MAARVAFGTMAVVLVAVISESTPHDDIGYELLFEDSTTPVDWDCWDAPNLPRWVNGSFVLPGVGQFSFGGLQFKGALDGFGKNHRFQLSDGQICMRARMMPTGFYNNSMKLGTVAPNMLFDETVPPRPPCPANAPKYPSCNVNAPNDNTFVNTVRLGNICLTRPIGFTARVHHVL